MKNPFSKDASSLLCLLAIIFLALLNLYTLMELKSDKDPLFLGMNERSFELGHPNISYYETNTQEFKECTQSLLLSNQANFPTTSVKTLAGYHLNVQEDIDLEKVAYEINLLDGIYVSQILEEEHGLYLELTQPGDLEQSAYWECFFQRQDFTKEASNWGIRDKIYTPK